jgi:hypothetical protein
MLKRNLFLITLFLLALSYSNAQRFTPVEEDEQKRWFVGGNLGLQLGYVTLVDVSPLVGYMVTERYAVGVGASYKYYRVRNFFYDTYLGKHYHLRSHIYGGQVFNRFIISRSFFAHAEYEFLRFRNEVYVRDLVNQRYDKTYDFVNVNSVFIGGGYRQFFGSASAFEIMVLYNLNDTPDSPYQNPLIRMGVVVGL